MSKSKSMSMNVPQTPLSDDEWLIRESGWAPDMPDRHREGDRESILALGNGYLGIRGALEESPEGATPQTYVAGVFDKSTAETVEIVNLPNPFDFRIYADGAPVAVDRMDVVSHERTLDMRKGQLYRETEYRSHVGRYGYRSVRALSAHDKHIAMMRVSFVSYDSDIDILVKSGIDASTMNIRPEMGTTVKHYTTEEEDRIGKTSYLSVMTKDSGIVVSYAAKLSVRRSDDEADAQDESDEIIESDESSGSDKSCGVVEVADVVRTSEWCDDRFTENLHFRAEKGVVYTVDRIVSVYTSRDLPREQIRDACLNAISRSSEIGFDGLLEAHIDSWNRTWEAADIAIECAGAGSDCDVARALRFNLYHLLIAGSDSDDQVSIAPKALTAEWYGGHVFWDTELFVLPFFTFTDPAVARNLLLYRYHRLPAARKNAREYGFAGARFPWESADTGEEATPREWFDKAGDLIMVHTMEREHHITADVAYAVYQYYMATGDSEFMSDYGAEIILESARFWASRAVKNDRTGRYEIRAVIGPNEYQECINNNAYTNYIAGWNLRCAVSLCKDPAITLPQTQLQPPLQPEADELQEWQRIADEIDFAVRDDGMIEEFEGYFKREDMVLSERNGTGMPVYPDAALMDRVQETQLVKQADVVMLLHLFPGDFSLDVKRANLEYYERRTTHESSLSPSIHSILYAETGDARAAYRYFKHALYGDLGGTYENTHHGIHSASMGGVWQAVVFGFAGVRMKGSVLAVNPRLPDEWTQLRFNLCWHGARLKFDISRSEVGISVGSAGDLPVSLEIGGVIHELSGNDTKVVEYGEND